MRAPAVFLKLRAVSRHATRIHRDNKLSCRLLQRADDLQLPTLSDDEQSVFQAMHAHLSAAIETSGGSLPFDRFMELALYAPGLGYYVNGRQKFGEQGDFITAPEASPLFARCLANQVAECLHKLDGGDVLEFGAGSGIMAAGLLAALQDLDCLPNRYLILELSAELQQRQQETLQREVPELASRVHWLDALPASGFNGVVIGNELLDAMPVHRFRRQDDAWQELSVVVDGAGFADDWHALRSSGLGEALQLIWPDGQLPGDGYESEINLRLRPWLDAVGHRMQRGYVLLIDYGYTRHEYYHPERNKGTLICHYRHRAYADPYLLPGLQDITANVDFTALARAALATGFDVAGYTTQAHFLIDAGLDRHLGASDPNDLQRHLELMQGVKKLTLPTEMGERFKVMALARDTDSQLLGFRTRDLRDRL